MRDLLFEAGGELVTGLRRLLTVTPNLQGASVERAPGISWLTRSFSQGEH